MRLYPIPSSGLRVYPPAYFQSRCVENGVNDGWNDNVLISRDPVIFFSYFLVKNS